MNTQERADKFKELYSLDVNSKVKQKSNLNYLSWSYAWAEFKKVYPDATYEVRADQNTSMPYFTSDLGIMVYTSVAAGGISYTMWLPVMDGANRALKTTPYTYKVFNKYKNIEEERRVEAANMTDINRAIMRCLVKNLAMFGLGLYIYEGEDVPEMSEDTLNDIADRIAQFDNVEDLTKFYKANEYMFSTNKKLMELVTAKGKELRTKNNNNEQKKEN